MEIETINTDRCRDGYNMRLVAGILQLATLFLPLYAVQAVASSSPSKLVALTQKTVKVTGMVTDKNREPLIGVNITVLGSQGPVRAVPT